MIELAAYELNKYYGTNHVIKGITFEIYRGEKIGLLGKNGSGKTTLFKILTGEEYYESGSIAKATGIRVEMLAQIPVFGENDTAEDILRSSFAEVTHIYREMKKLEGDENPELLAQYGRLMEEYERLGGYDTEVKLNKICNGMHIPDHMRQLRFSQLSGGEKTRVNLARILLRECDVLLLDEPTNHLDLISLEWLEAFLRDFAGTVVVISHDRVFLDSVVTRIIELDHGKANFYKGNYSYYVEEKAKRFSSQSEQYEQQQKKIHQLEAAAKRLHMWAQQADSAALHKKAFAIEKRIERMDKVEKPQTEQKITAGFDSGGYAAKEIISFDGVTKSFGTKTLFADMSLKIYKNDSIALVGDNGCGKTTLLKMIMNEEPGGNGKMKVSVNVKPAYMPQIIEFENETATVLETLREELNYPEEKARSVLARFQFKAADVFKKVSTLSGGEKSRLKLCLLMQRNVNFLLLDEPTNHLDIASREWVENALTDFDGTILFVSHDRYFLNKFADKVWHMEHGKIVQYAYGFDEYLEKIRQEAAAETQKGKHKPPAAKEPIKPVSTEIQIAEAEAQLEKTNAALEEAIARSDGFATNRLRSEQQRLTKRIEALYHTWLQENESHPK